MPFTSFDSGISKSANITLSNSNLTMTSNASTNGGATSTHCKNQGKFYVEFSCSSEGAGGGVGIRVNANGLQTTAAPYIGAYTDLVNSGLGGAVVYMSENIWINGSSVGSTGTGSNGQTVGVAIDLDNKKIWFRVNSNNWNNSGTANPAANTGGFDISAIVPAAGVYLCAFVPTSGNNITLNAGAAPFSFTAPSGFGGWSASNDSGLTIDIGSEISTYANSASTISLDADSNGADRVLMLHVHAENNTTLRTISSVSGGGLTWVLHKSLNFVSGSIHEDLEIWWAHAPTALTASSITVTLSGSADGVSAVLYSVAGANISDPFDTNASIPGTASDVSGSATTGQVTGLTTDTSDPLVIGAWANANGPTGGVPTQEAGFSLLGSINDHFPSNWSLQMAETQAPLSALSSTTVSTTTNRADWGMIVTALAAGSGTRGSMAATEATDVATLTGNPLLSGTLAVTGTADILEFTGHESGPSGSLAATETADALEFSGGPTGPVSGIFTGNESFDGFAALGEVNGGPPARARRIMIIC